jgi:hypothetical protein
MFLLLCFSLMGLPGEDEWPQESPIMREAFTNYSQSVITLERLVRFSDSCGFELLRVSLFRFIRILNIHFYMFIFSHYCHLNKVFVRQLCEPLNTIFSVESTIPHVQYHGP